MNHMVELIAQDMDLIQVINKGNLYNHLISYIIYKINLFLIIRCFTIGVKNLPNEKEIFEEIEQIIFLELRNIIEHKKISKSMIEQSIN
jgi:hypothetical protein